MARPDEQKAPRIPSLDGLRGVLVLLVCFAHLLGTRGFLPKSVDDHVGDLGLLGVRCFFVLSGFLITTLLLQEVERTGRIDLRAFYLRRVYRIFPAFYVYLSVITAAVVLGVAAVPAHDLAFSALYSINYKPGSTWLVGHLWSLSVEEHFYLLWPATLLLLPGATPEAKRRSAVAANLLVIAMGPVLRLGTVFFFPRELPRMDHFTHTVADALAFGCLLASARDRLWAQPAYRRFLSSPAFVMVPLLAAALNWASPHVRFHAAVGDTLISISATLVIDRVVRFPEAASGRLLNWAPLVWIGARSYSIYLWQQPFLWRDGGSSWNRFPINLGLAILLGALSHALVEQPILRLARRRAAEAEPLVQS